MQYAQNPVTTVILSGVYFIRMLLLHSLSQVHQLQVSDSLVQSSMLRQWPHVWSQQETETLHGRRVLGGGYQKAVGAHDITYFPFQRQTLHTFKVLKRSALLLRKMFSPKVSASVWMRSWAEISVKYS